MRDKYNMHYGELLIQAGGDKTEIKDSDLQGIIPDQYKDEYKATSDGLTYIGDNEEHKEIAKDMGIEIGDRPEIPVIKAVNITPDDTSAYIEADVTESRSGIVEYNFKIKEKNGTYKDHKTDQKELLKEGLKENTHYVVVLVVTDRDGHVVTSTEYPFTTESPRTIEAPTFSQVNEAWTQGPVSLTITYTKQIGAKHYYSFTGKDNEWTEVTSGNIQNLSITENGTVYAKSVGASGTESKVVRKEIKNIDNKKPEAPKVSGTQPSGEATNQDVTLTVSGSSSPSGIAKYQYSTDGGTTWKDYPAGNKLVISEEGTTEVISRAVSNTGVAGEPSEKYIVKIDKTAPKVSTINVTSPASGEYKAGTTVTVTVTFSENIKGTPVPELKIKFGSGNAKAMTPGTLQNNTITYTYTIVNGDNGKMATVSYSGGNITDLVGNILVPENKPLGGNEIIADTVLPELQTMNVISPASDTYKAGTEITIRATYSEPVKGTAPVLKVKFGNGTERTTTSPGTITTASTTIDYKYTIQAGDNGTLVSTSYTGTVTDVSGNPVTVSNKALGGNTIIADTIAPTVTSLTVSSPGTDTYKAGTVVTIKATWSENIYGDANRNAVTAATAPVLKIKFGSSTERTATFNSVSGNIITYTYTIQSGDNGKIASTSYSGTLYDFARNAGTATNKTLGGNSITADTIASTVSSINVTSPASETYKAGQVITLVATWSENVYGDANRSAITASTAPVLKVKFGSSTERTATFKSASGNTITYTYTIAAGDNGVLASTSYTGTVYDFAKNSGAATNKTLGGSSITADTVAATLTSIDVIDPATGVYKAGDVVTIVATYSENVYGNESRATITASTAPVLKVKFGSGTERTATFGSATGNTVKYYYTIQGGDNGVLASTSYTGTVYDYAKNSTTVSNQALGGNTITADTTAPLLNSIAVVSPASGTYKAGTAITIRATYNEPIKGTPPTLKIKFGSGAERTATAPGAITTARTTIDYTYTIVSGDNGALSTTAYTGSITDNVGNPLTVSNQTISGNRITADTIAPTCTITSSVGSPTNAASITYTFTFSESVSNFVSGDIIVTNGTKGAFSGSGNKYTLVVTTTANQNNTQTVAIAANVANDVAGNGNVGASKSLVIDRVAPTCTITSSVGTPTNAASITYTFTFSESVSNFVTGDITVTNGTKGTFSGSGNKYTLVVTTAAGQNNTQTVAIAANVANDAAGNGNSAASLSRVIDRVAPTCTITSSVGTPTNAASITYTFTFSESVSNFVTGDIALTNGTKGAFSGSGNKYTLVVTTAANQNNTQTVSIAANVANDAAGNGNSAASYSRVIDRVAPTITALTMKSSNANASYVKNGETVTLSMTFSKSVATNPTVTIGGRSATVSGSGTTRTATYTIPAAEASLAQGALGVSVSGYKDAVGNTGATRTTLTSGALTIYDRTAPTVNNIAAGTMLNSDATFASGVNGTYVYNNSGNGTVTNTRVAISGAPESSGYGLEVKTTGAASPGHGGFTFGTPSAAGKIYITRLIAKIPVGYTLNWASNATGDGRTAQWLTTQAGTGQWQEYALKLTCGTTGTFSSTNYYYLTGGSTATASAPVVWQVAYATVIDTTKWGTSNAIVVTGSDTTGVVGSGYNQSSSTAPSLTSGSAMTTFAKVYAGITTNGTYYAWLKDATGNQGATAVAVNRVDRTAPTCSITATTNGPTNAGSITYTFTFSENVYNFVTGDIAVTNGTKSTFTQVSPSQYTLVVNTAANQNNTQTVAIAAGVANDEAGNGNTAASKSVVIDRVAPTCTITSNVGSPTNASSITYTFTFSENVSNFVAGDIAVTNGTKGTFSGSGKTYTLVVTTAAGQNNTQSVSIAAGVANDAAGNGNTGASLSRVIDRVAPTCTITSNVGSPTNAASITYTFTFSESVSNFVTGDITVTNGTKGTFSGSGTTYTLVVTTAAGQNNTQTVSIGAGVANDAAGNGNTAASLSRIIDKVAPTITVTQPTTEAYPLVLTVNATDTTSNISYIEMPDGTKVNGNGTKTLTSSYNVTKDGNVIFKASDALGQITTYTFNVTNVYGYKLEWTVPANTTITLPVSGNVNLNVNYGDGSIQNVTSDQPTHTYTNAGTYTMKLTGNCDTLDFKKFSGSATYVTKLVQFGCLGNKKLNFSYANITSVPSPHAKSFEKVTDFSFVFYYCDKLESIPANLFANCTNATTFSNAFKSCENLKSIPSNLFANCSNVTDFSRIFEAYGTTSSALTGTIPGNIFDNCIKAENFLNAFYGCSKLSGTIPSELFEDSPNAINFNGTFAKIGTTSIGPNLFKKQTKVTEFSTTFMYSSITAIPTGLFSNNKEVLEFMQTFERTNITQVPSDLFSYATKATTIAYVLQATNINTIPSNLLANNKECTAVSGLFQDTKITSIPSTLFAQNSKLIYCNYTFASCINLTTIPSNLFSNNVNIDSFGSTFLTCTSLQSIPASLFNNNQNVTDFSRVFYSCSNLTGNAPTLWTRTNVKNYKGAFYNCKKLSNYSTIPASWRTAN